MNNSEGFRRGEKYGDLDMVNTINLFIVNSKEKNNFTEKGIYFRPFPIPAFNFRSGMMIKTRSPVKFSNSLATASYK